MIRWMCGISLKELRRLVGVEPITIFFRSGRMRWYGHVIRKGDEDWVKKCMEYRVEGRRPVGRPRKTWLESVEADIAKLEIDKEDVYDRDNITFTTTDIPSTINTHNIELQMVKVHINNTKHITIANIYIPPRDTTSTHYKTADTDIQHCIKYITNIPHSVLTGDVNAHSTLWHSYTDDHRGQQIADVISNSDHITLNTNTPTRVPNTTLQQTSSPDITTVSNTLYNRTSWTTQHALSSDHLPIITTINIRHDYRLQQNRRTFTNYKKADWTQFTEDTESAFAQTTIPTNIHTANRIFTNIILMADKQNIPKARCTATAGSCPKT